MLEIVNSGSLPAHGWRVTITSPSEAGQPGKLCSKSGTPARWGEQPGEDEQELPDGRRNTILVRRRRRRRTTERATSPSGALGRVTQGEPVKARYELLAERMDPLAGTLVIRHLSGPNAEVVIEP